MKTSVVIPNWNGKELLRKNLPAVLEGGFDEIIVVDDGSTDDSVEYLKSLQTTDYRLRLIFNKGNLGFGKSVNRGVEATSADIVFLLNTDVRPEGDVVSPVLRHFKDPKVFGVSLNEGKFGWARPKIENGFVGHEPGGKTNKPHATFWVSGGSGVFRKSMWDELGGLDTVYSPFYWEDVDLSFRALKKGWKLIWEPAVKVEHEHEATINKKFFSPRYLNYIKERNQLLFHWKNLEIGWIVKYHLLGVVKRFIRHPGYAVPLLLAAIKFPTVFLRRISVQEKDLSVEDVLRRV